MSRLTKAQRESYESDIKAKSDWNAGMRFAAIKAEEKGKAEGKIEGKAEGKIEGKAEGKIEGKAEGKIEGKAEGKIEGKAEGKLEIAAKLKKKGLLNSEIAELTGLSLEEIEKL